MGTTIVYVVALSSTISRLINAEISKLCITRFFDVHLPLLHILVQLIFHSNQTIRVAVNEWCASIGDDMKAKQLRDEVLKRYGHISVRIVTSVTDMSDLFSRQTSFNDNIEQWDVRNVRDLSRMYFLATIFNQPLISWNVNVKHVHRSMRL